MPPPTDINGGAGGGYGGGSSPHLPSTPKQTTAAATCGFDAAPASSAADAQFRHQGFIPRVRSSVSGFFGFGVPGPQNSGLQAAANASTLAAGSGGRTFFPVGPRFRASMDTIREKFPKNRNQCLIVLMAIMCTLAVIAGIGVGVWILVSPSSSLWKSAESKPAADDSGSSLVNRGVSVVGGLVLAGIAIPEVGCHYFRHEGACKYSLSKHRENAAFFEAAKTFTNIDKVQIHLHCLYLWV